MQRYLINLFFVLFLFSEVQLCAIQELSGACKLVVSLAHRQSAQPSMQTQDAKKSVGRWLWESAKKNPYIIVGLGISLGVYQARYHLQALFFDKQKLLAEAITNSNIEKLRAVVSMGGNVNKSVNEWGVTPLILAAMKSRPKVVSILIKLGASLDTQESMMGWTALMDAAHRNDSKITQILLEAGANINITPLPSQGFNAVDRALTERNVDVVPLLLEAGGKLNIDWIDRMDIEDEKDKQLLEIMNQYKKAAAAECLSRIKTALHEQPIEMPKDLSGLVGEYIMGNQSDLVIDKELLEQYALEKRNQFMRRINHKKLKDKQSYCSSRSRLCIKKFTPVAVLILGIVGLLYHIHNTLPHPKES